MRETTYTVLNQSCLDGTDKIIIKRNISEEIYCFLVFVTSESDSGETEIKKQITSIRVQ